MRAARAPQMQLILTASDRARYGFKTGLYEVCLFGLQDSTVSLTPIEEATGGRYTAENGVVYTINVPARRTATYFRFTQEFLAQKANITVKVEGLSANLTAGQAPPRIFYRVCGFTTAWDCSLNASEQNGTVKNMVELAPNVI